MNLPATGELGSALSPQSVRALGTAGAGARDGGAPSSTSATTTTCTCCGAASADAGPGVCGAWGLAGPAWAAPGAGCDATCGATTGRAVADRLFAWTFARNPRRPGTGRDAIAHGLAVGIVFLVGRACYVGLFVYIVSGGSPFVGFLSGWPGLLPGTWSWCQEAP